MKMLVILLSQRP